jgi:hypothetical protein
MDSIRKYEENQEYYENLDKRTKEYKTYAEWKANREAASEGLGDSIEKITEATGIKAAVKFLAGEDCGCDERKEKLNEMFGYRNPECLLEEEYDYLKELFSKRISSIDINTQRQLLKISNRVFRRNQRPSSCGSCVRKMYENLKKYFDAYDK